MSAVQNFQNGQQQLAQSMTAPLQAGQTQQTAPLYNQQSPAQVAHQQYQQQISPERQRQADLAKQMQQGAMQAGQAAIGSGLESANAASNLKQINSAGRIQAKHPLDLLAIGIRGWKASEAQKKTTATAAQAKQDAYKAAQADEASKRAAEREEWLWRKEMESKTPKEAEEMTKARMEQKFLLEDNEQENRGIAPADRQYSVPAMGGQDIIRQREKETRMTGTGDPVDLESGVDTELQKGILSNQAGIEQLTRVEDGFKPEYFGVKGAAGGLLGKVQDIAGFSEGDMSKFNAERSEYLSSLYQFSNKLIKERSGAAVTAQEWERFKKEFPVGFMGAQEFKVRLAGYIEDMAAENVVKLRQGGWEIKDGVIAEKEGAPAMADAEIEKLTGRPIGAKAEEPAAAPVYVRTGMRGGKRVGELEDGTIVEID